MKVRSLTALADQQSAASRPSNNPKTPPSSNDRALTRFVGVDAYEAAGGQVMRDLFAEEYEHGVWFEDPVLLEKLATDRLHAAADELATRWKWAVPMIEVAWDDTARYGRIEPQPGVPTDEEKAEIEELETRHDELANLDEEDWTDELVAEGESVMARLEEIQGAIKARAVFRRDDFAMAGCIATIGRDGTLQVIAGLVKPEDVPKREKSTEAGTQAANGHDAHATEPEPEPSGDAATVDPGLDADASEADPDPAVAGGPDGIAATGRVNRHDAPPDLMEIPEFLRRVH